MHHQSDIFGLFPLNISTFKHAIFKWMGVPLKLHLKVKIYFPSRKNNISTPLEEMNGNQKCTVCREFQSFWAPANCDMVVEYHTHVS